MIAASRKFIVKYEVKKTGMPTDLGIGCGSTRDGVINDKNAYRLPLVPSRGREMKNRRYDFK